jgi:crossover junction endodeoxyribonuclease RuvC
MLVIGFDPGSISFGIGILKKEKNKIFYIYSDEIKLKEKDFNRKMKTLWRHLNALYSRFPIDIAAIEEGFLGKNVKSMNILAKVRGVVLGSLIAEDIELKYYSPREIKLAITGTGSALKIQVEKMIKTLLNIKKKELGSDESDALAVAYCHFLYTSNNPPRGILNPQQEPFNRMKRK